jgi:hypothetical protein
VDASAGATAEPGVAMPCTYLRRQRAVGGVAEGASRVGCEHPPPTHPAHPQLPPPETVNNTPSGTPPHFCRMRPPKECATMMGAWRPESMNTCCAGQERGRRGKDASRHRQGQLAGGRGFEGEDKVGAGRRGAGRQRGAHASDDAPARGAQPAAGRALGNKWSLRVSHMYVLCYVVLDCTCTTSARSDACEGSVPGTMAPLSLDAHALPPCRSACTGGGATDLWRGEHPCCSPLSDLPALRSQSVAAAPPLL